MSVAHFIFKGPFSMIHGRCHWRKTIIYKFGPWAPDARRDKQEKRNDNSVADLEYIDHLRWRKSAIKHHIEQPATVSGYYSLLSNH